MTERVWINARQPQTLYLSQLLMYFRGAVGTLFLLIGFSPEALFGSDVLSLVYVFLNSIGLVLAAYGIANAKTWGYQLGVVAAFAPLVFTALVVFAGAGMSYITTNIIGIMFDVALVALLLHPMSVEHRKYWFS